MTEPIQIDPTRLAKFEAARLVHGSHRLETEGVGCVMNWANFLAGGDGALDTHPCVSRPIAALLIRLNDRLSDENRQQLKPYATKILGTAATPEIERQRAWMAADCAIREIAPLWLDAAGLAGEATALRALPAVNSENHEAARKRSREAREKAWALRQEHWDKADAADAAYDAADAAYAAAYAAAADAAYAAAAADAARKKLAPVAGRSLGVVLSLLDRMIAISGGGHA